MENRKIEINWEERIHQLQRIMKKNTEEKNYLFLDFDGVINVFHVKGTPEYEEKAKKKTFEFYDRNCVGHLNLLCHQFPIEIVLSTSWRFAGLEYCHNYLKEAGLDQEIPVVGTTEDEIYKSRPEEITDYLLSHQDFTGFLILDDGFMEPLKDYQVLTNPTKGFDQTKLIEAQQILQTFHKK